MTKSLQILLALIKYKVSVAVTFTAITGYIIYTSRIDFDTILLALGVFTLAGGSSALNEWQERLFDAKMDRTKERPLPAGKIAPHTALIISLTLIIGGCFTLQMSFGNTTAALGLFNVIWYNLLYTKLKRITPFAVIPGSLVGAVPIFMGWCAAGGYLFDRTIIFIAFFLFIWQIPHFWLLMLKYGKEYEKAGFPTIGSVLSISNLKTIIFSWIIATSFTSIIIPLFLVNISWAFFVIIFILNILFVATFTSLSFARNDEIGFKRSFISINFYMLLFMVLLIAFHLL